MIPSKQPATKITPEPPKPREKRIKGFDQPLFPASTKEYKKTKPTHKEREKTEAFIRNNIGKQATIVTCRVPELNVPYTVILSVTQAVMAKKGWIRSVDLL